MSNGGSELRTVNEIIIAAPADTVYALAADVAAWPRILPHYRYVTVLDHPASSPEYRPTVKMGARRTRIPVGWTSSQLLRPGERRINYFHLRGVTRGMEVEWRIEEVDEGTRATIVHVLNSPYPWLRSRIARYVVGRLFVEHIAERTLHGIKRQAEMDVAGVTG